MGCKFFNTDVASIKVKIGGVEKNVEKVVDWNGNTPWTPETTSNYLTFTSNCDDSAVKFSYISGSNVQYRKKQRLVEKLSKRNDYST